MSLLWADFPSGQSGLYGTDTSNMLDGLWAQVEGTLVDDPEVLITGNVLRMISVTDSSAPQLGNITRKALPAAVTTIGVGLRVYFGSLPPSGTSYPQILVITDQATTAHLTFLVLPTGAIEVLRGSPGSSTSLGTTAPVIVASAWQNVEIKATINDTTGSVEIRVEGISVLSLTNVDTANSANVHADQIMFCAAHTGGQNTTYYIKDMVIWDTAGSINNDFFGSVSVYALLTDGDVSLNWTPSTGATGWDLLDESPPSDADYISAADPPPAPAVMSLTNLPADVTSVRGLIAIARSMKTDGGDGNLQVGMKSGASTGLGTDRPITTAFTYWSDVFELDPATSAAWTPPAVDAANIQFNRTV